MESPHSLRPLSLGHEGRVPGGRRASPAHAGGSSQASRGQQTVPAGLKPWLGGVLLGGGGQEGLRGGGGCTGQGCGAGGQVHPQMARRSLGGEAMAEAT